MFVGKLTPGVVSRRDTAVSVSGLKSSSRTEKLKGEFFSPFLYLYNMKLLVTLKNLILIEENNNPRGTTIFSTVLNNKFIQLKSTYHQRKERHGDETYEDIVYKYNDFLYTNKSKFRQPPRFAVPDTMIKNFFSSNIEKIYSAFEKEQPKNNKIIFVHKRKNNQDEENFDYIEVLLQKDGNFFNIITSAFSKDGRFLKTRREEDNAERITVEEKSIDKYIVIYI